jgi:NADH-quinone oxidoreductase subunit C
VSTAASLDLAALARARLVAHIDAEVGYEEGFGPPTIDVPADRWVDALRLLRDEVGCTYFDWLSAVDELDQGFSVLCHVAKLSTPAEAPGPDEVPASDKSQATASSGDAGQSSGGEVAHLLVRTRVPREAPVLPTVTTVFAGAAWHERETREMFGIDFAGHPGLTPLLLPEEFEGHPLRKEFVLASRVAKPWPGAKEPGESDHPAADHPAADQPAPGQPGLGQPATDQPAREQPARRAPGRAPSRRRMAPPGVPAVEDWGPRPPGSPAPDPLAAATPSTRSGRRGRRTERPDRTARPADRTARPADRTTQPTDRPVPDPETAEPDTSTGGDRD